MQIHGACTILSPLSSMSYKLTGTAANYITIFLPVRNLSRQTKSTVCCLKCGQKHASRNFHVQQDKKQYGIPRSSVARWCFRRNNEQWMSTYQRQSASRSALYINPQDPNNVAVVEVDLDLDEKFKDIDKLEANVKARKLDVNVHKFWMEYKGMRKMQAEKEALEEKREDIARQMAGIMKEKEASAENEEKKTALIAQGKEVKMQLKMMSKNFWTLQEKVMLDALKLPTELHPETPATDETIEEVGEKKEFSFKPRTHKKLGKRNQMLKFSSVSPGAYYLRGRLALLEQQILRYFSDRLLDNGVQQMTCPEMVKTLVLESCGRQFYNPSKVFTLQSKMQESPKGGHNGEAATEPMAKWHSTFHLPGISCMSFAAYLAKMNIEEKCLPLKYFAAGRSYAPGGDVKQKGLVAVPQASVVELFAATRGVSESVEIYKEYRHILWELYKSLELPVRLVRTGVDRMSIAQSRGTHIAVWVPRMNKYVKVAEVSMSNDFVARRLMTKYSTNINDITNRKYIHMVNGTAVHVPRLLAAIMENLQHQTGFFDIPTVLQ